MTTPTPRCELARQTVYTDGSGLTWEGFWLGGRFIFQNQIHNVHSKTRTNPGWILHDDGFCQWRGTPPPRLAEYQELPATTEQPIAPATLPATQQNLAPGAESGGGFLLVLGVIGAAIYAVWQQKNGKADFADDYHPMSDVPTLPAVYTDENLDYLHERHRYPQYQGITEPSPFGLEDTPPVTAAPSQLPPPPGATYVPPVESTTNSTGGGELVESVVDFKDEWLPAPKNGYELSDESVLASDSLAWQIVDDALEVGISVNFLMTYLFKISKNTKQHELLKDLIEVVKRDRDE